MSGLFIGLMSGTSLDGIDGVLVRFPDTGARGLQVLGHAHQAFEPDLRAELLALNTAGDNELHRAALAANALAREQASLVPQLLARCGVSPDQVLAIGSHGQTVRHQPGQCDATGYTLQLNNPALLAELSGISVAADFRSRDVAAGGQGAPLVPAFHAQVFGASHARAILNLGGIANLTLLPGAGAQASQDATADVIGFDCGPANALLDDWIQRHQGLPFDDNGAWAAGGQVIADLLAELLSEPFLQAPAPKSTGRDLFNPRWLADRMKRLQAGRRLEQQASPWSAQDVQATLAEFSAQAAALALQRYAPACRDLLVCGGGAFNADLMARLETALPGWRVASTEEHGLPPTQVEAAAFAWLAWALWHKQPANLPAVTGARGLRLLGALYPA